jgi:hypothetical protein
MCMTQKYRIWYIRLSLQDLKWWNFCHPIKPHHQERESRLIARGWLRSSTCIVHVRPTVCLGGTHVDS